MRCLPCSRRRSRTTRAMERTSRKAPSSEASRPGCRRSSKESLRARLRIRPVPASQSPTRCRDPRRASLHPAPPAARRSREQERCACRHAGGVRVRWRGRATSFCRRWADLGIDFAKLRTEHRRKRLCLVVGDPQNRHEVTGLGHTQGDVAVRAVLSQRRHGVGQLSLETGACAALQKVAHPDRPASAMPRRSDGSCDAPRPEPYGRLGRWRTLGR